MVEVIKSCDKEMFEKILSGEKEFEVRIGDMKAKKGDTSILKENNFKTGKLTGREVKKKIGFTLRTKEIPYWKKEDIDKYGFLVMQLEAEL